MDCAGANNLDKLDISKGVWFHYENGTATNIFSEQGLQYITIGRIDGEKFVREGVPDGFCQKSCAYFSLVRRFALALTILEVFDLRDEAKRISPEMNKEG